LQSAQLKGETGIEQTNNLHFGCCLNISRDGEEVMSEGKSFHIHAPVTGKARRPTVESLTAGTDRLSVIEDRSLCRDRMSAVRVNCRYCKASACSVRH